MLRSLIFDRGLDPNRSDGEGWVPLHIALAECGCSHLHQQVALFLITDVPTVNVNARRPDGITALMVAAAGGMVDIMRALDDVHGVENHPSIAGRGHVISLSAKQFSYESPFTDLEKASSHKDVFAKIPSSVFPLPSSDMVDMWNTLQPFAHEYVSHEENNMFNFCDSAI